MRIRNIVEKANNVKVDENYDADAITLSEIANAYKHPFDSCYTAFRYGYMQGCKAEKKAMKNKNL